MKPKCFESFSHNSHLFGSFNILNCSRGPHGYFIKNSIGPMSNKEIWGKNLFKLDLEVKERMRGRLDLLKAFHWISSAKKCEFRIGAETPAGSDHRRRKQGHRGMCSAGGWRYWQSHIETCIDAVTGRLAMDLNFVGSSLNDDASCTCLAEYWAIIPPASLTGSGLLKVLWRPLFQESLAEMEQPIGINNDARGKKDDRCGLAAQLELHLHNERQIILWFGHQVREMLFW